MAQKLRTVKTMYQRKKKRKLYILGDRMVKKLNGYLISKRVT